MGIMVGLVLFSSSVALLLYLKQGKTAQNQQNNIEVFVAAKDIKKGELLNAATLKKAKLPKSYISLTPLMDTEIIGRYANVNIYKDEPIRREKITNVKPQKTVSKKTVTKKANSEKTEKAVPVQLSADTLLVPLKLFRNTDSSLKMGDFVDIACVVPSNNKTRTNSFSTKYVVLHVKINHFSNHGNKQNSMIVHGAKNQTIQADAIRFQMSPTEIKNFLEYYYKTQALNDKRIYNLNNYGGQLWMIKTPKEIDEKLQKQKERLLVNRHVSKKKRKQQAQRVKISYEN